MAFTKINAAGIGTTETVTVDGLTVINDGSFGGNLTVSGVLTYEDVTNVDSVGLITARNGIVVGSGITLSKDGDGFFTGIITATTFVGNLTGTASANAVLTGSTNNTLVTVTGANAIAGESNLTFDGNLLKLQCDSGEFRVEAANGVDAFSVDSDNGNTIIGGSGTLTIPDTIVHAGDTDTKIRFPSADNISFEVAGTERLRIDDSDGVIAQHTTAANLRIENSTAASSQVAQLDMAPAGSISGVQLKCTSEEDFSTGANRTAYFSVHNRKDGSFYERLRITSDGKVGINETSPDQALHVKSTDSDAVPLRVQSAGTSSRIGFEAAGSSNSYNVGCGAAASPNAGNEFAIFTSDTERVRIASDGSVGFGLGSSYAPETPIDVVTNWANTRSDITTVSTYHRKLPLNERGDITLTARHSSTKDGAVGYVGPIIDFRSTNSSNEEWTVAQLVGGTDPLNGNGYQGDLSIFASNGGNNDPAGRRNQGDAPTLSAVFAPFRITTFCSTGNQGSSCMHITKNFAANNVQSDMIHFDVNGAGRGRIMSADSGSNSPSFGAYSDRRLKTNFRNYTGGYDRIKAIPVKLYDEVLNDQTKSIFGDHVKNDVIGWIADEVQSVFPEAVVGTKDQVATADDVTAGISTAIGDPIYQSLAEGRFLPDAIQAIQKLIEKVETLETKVAALEG